MRLLNCWLVSRWLWLASRFRAYLWKRRSLHFGGAVIHSGTAHVTGFRNLSVVEFVPPHRELWTKRNMVVLYDGEYRVWEMRPVAVRRMKTVDEVLAWTSRRESSSKA